MKHSFTYKTILTFCFAVCLTFSCNSNNFTGETLDAEFYGINDKNNLIILRKDKTCFARIKKYQVTCKYRIEREKIFFEFNSYFAQPTFGKFSEKEIHFSDETFTTEAPRKF